MNQPPSGETGQAKVLDCQHEYMNVDCDECILCGAKFVVCEACSAAGGADREIKHMEPVCTSKLPASPEKGSELK